MVKINLFFFLLVTLALASVGSGPWIVPETSDEVSEDTFGYIDHYNNTLTKQCFVIRDNTYLLNTYYKFSNILVVNFAFAWLEIVKYNRKFSNEKDRLLVNLFMCVGASLCATYAPYLFFIIGCLLLGPLHLIGFSALFGYCVNFIFLCIPILFTPIYEEMAKEFIPYFPLVFPLFEFITWYIFPGIDYGGDIIWLYCTRLSPLLMHLLIINRNFIDRCFIHIGWNFIGYLPIFFHPDICLTFGVNVGVYLLQLFFLSICLLPKFMKETSDCYQIQRHMRESIGDVWHYDKVITKTNQIGVRMFWIKRTFSDGSCPITGPQRPSKEEAYAAFYNVERESDEQEEEIWYFDYIVFDSRDYQRFYKVRRMFSNGLTPIDGPSRITVLEAYQAFKNRIERESFESFPLIGSQYTSTLFNFIPMFHSEIIFIVTLLLNMNELYRAKAEPRAYYVLFFSTFANWANNRLESRAMYSYLCTIYEYVCDKLQQPSDVISFEEWRKEFLPQNMNTETKHKINLDWLRERQGIDRHSFESGREEYFRNKPFKLIADFFSVGAGLFAIVTIPSLTNLQRIKSHLYSTQFEYSKNSIVDIGTFIYGLACSCYSLFVSLYIAYVGNNFSSLFKSHVAMRFSKLEECQRNLEMFSLTEDNPHLPYPNLQEYELQLRSLEMDLSNGAGIMSNSDRSRKIEILKSWSTELKLGRFKSRPRRAPLVLCLHGDTCIGKSSLVNMLIGSYATIQSSLGFNIDLGSHVCERVYRHNPASKHWDGCKSTHWCFVLDDIAHERDLGQTDSPSTAALLDLVGNLPFFPPMASLSDKGNTVAAPRLVMLTTNNKSLGAHQTHHCPTALQRRVNFYVEVKLNPEFTTPEGYLDSAKASKLDDYDITRIWRFKVEVPDKQKTQDGRFYTKYKALSLNKSDYSMRSEDSQDEIVTSENMDWSQFIRWYKSAIIRHDATQSRVVDIMGKQAMNMIDCKTCGFCHAGRKDNCQPVELQRHSLEIINNARNWIKHQYIKFSHQSNKYPWYTEFYSGYFKGLGLELHELFPADIEFVRSQSENDGVTLLNNFALRYNRCILFSDGVSIGGTDYGSIRINMSFPLTNNELQYRGDNFLSRCFNKYFEWLFIYLLILSVYYLLPFLFVFFLLGVFTTFYVYNRLIIISRTLSIMSIFPFTRSRVQLQQLLCFLGVITLICGLTMNYNKLFKPIIPNFQRNGAEMSMPEEEKRKAWWSGWIDNPELHRDFTFSHQSGTARPNTSNYDILIDTIKRNTLKCECRTPGSSLVGKCRALAIDNQHLLINNHSLFSKSSKGLKFDRLIVYKFNLPVGRLERKMEVILDEYNCKQICPDVVLIRVASTLDCKSIVEYFCNDDFTGVCSGRNDFYETQEEKIVTLTNRANGAFQRELNLEDTCEFLLDESFRGVPERVWVFPKCVNFFGYGSSGSCWVTDECRAAMILGIHMGANQVTKEQYCSVVSRQIIQKGISSLDSGSPIKPMFIRHIERESKEFFWSAGGLEAYPIGGDNFKEIHNNAPGKYIEPHSGFAFRALRYRNEGSHTTDMHYHKSHTYWSEKGIISNKFIPNLSEFRKPSWWIGIQELNKIPLSVQQGQFMICARHYYDGVINKLKDIPDWQNYLGKFSVQEAVHGNPKMNYVDRMNLQTSAGFPIYKKKNRFLKADDVIPKFLLERVEYLDKEYRDGNRVNPVFVAHQKDEFLSERKFTNKQLRVFMGSPVDFTIIVRIYLLSFVRLMQTHRLLFESAVAIVVQGPDWSDLYNYLTDNGRITRFIAGDYKFYDKGMHIYVLNMACSIIRDILIESGKYSSEDIAVIELLLQDIINCVVDYDGTLIFLEGSNPSGHPLTVLLNCIVGSLYIRYSFLQKFGNLDNFNDNNIRLITYGDDNVIGVSNDLEFTFTNMRDGISAVAHYTTADKQEDGQDYLDIKDVTFLKRSFIKSDFLTRLFKREYWICPIEIDSIHKILHGGKGTLSEDDALLISLKTALSELAFHPKETYDKYAQMIYECADHFNLSLIRRTYECQQFRWVVNYLSLDELNLTEILPDDEESAILGQKPYGAPGEWDSMLVRLSH